MADNNPRPLKRAKVEYPSNTPPHFSSSPLTPLPSSQLGPASSPLKPTAKGGGTNAELKPLPPTVLLTSLPGLLIHPPNHRYHKLSVQLSLTALRKCLTLPALSPEVECRAWTGLAEIGMNVISGGLAQDNDCTWAKGIEAEVSKALSKGAIIAQKHPNLRPFKHHIALLQARFSHWQHKTKFARTQLRNLISTFQPSDPPYILYSAHLALISLLTSPHSTPTPNSNDITVPPSHTPKARDLHAALAAVQDLEALSTHQRHPKVILLAQLLRLRILASSEQWSEIPQALSRAEGALGLSYEPTTTPKPRKPPAQTDAPNGEKPKRPKEMFISFDNPFEACMAIHTIMIAVVYYTHIGEASQASPRLSHLHGLLDEGALETFADGIVPVECGTSTPLMLQVTHPRIILLLGFLISTIAKRDAVGRRPKRRVFAAEGVKAWDREITHELLVPLWSDMGNVDEIEQRFARIKADLLCELIAACIMRSEFDAAEENLNLVIAHTRTYNLFHLFAARISLHHAHLAHALGRKERALECYRMASRLSEEGQLVGVVARAGEISIRLAGVQCQKEVTERSNDTKANGKKRAGSSDDDGDSASLERELMEVQEMATNVIENCKGMGGTVRAIGHILEACISPEILTAKSHLKMALALATNSQDNHLRALIMAFIASQYMYTAGDHARSVLQTIDQLGAGLGASLKGDDGKVKVCIGNAPLRLWAGERLGELYRRSGQQSQADEQMAINARFACAVEALGRRGC